jgi:predicted ATP-binding protein involved in virulence
MPKPAKPIPMYFASMQIENVRCFGDRQELNLTAGDRNPARWTLILGDNGVGKTTILQCLAWMRLVPLDNFPVDQPGRSSDSGEHIPLTKGLLGPALLDEDDDKLLESLLRADTAENVFLGSSTSFGAPLSSVSSDCKSTTKRSKIISTGVSLSFHERRLEKVTVTRKPKIEVSLGGQFPDPLTVSYGANRFLGKRNLTTDRLDNPIAAARLSESTELCDVEELLSRLDYASAKKGVRSRERTQLNRMLEALAKILPGDFKSSDFQLLPPDILDRPWEPSGLRLKTYSGSISLSDLSFGFQTTIAWATDFAWRLLQRYPSSHDPLAEPAVVLIDEIDLHLHPHWQLRIIDDLSAIFPGTQFIATSHSPLIVQVAETANLVLLRKRETDAEIVNDPEVIRSWRVDQILMSELFSVPRARSEHTERLLKRRAELVDKPSRSRAEETELLAIRNQISALPTASDPEDQKAMDYLREAAAFFRKRLPESNR